MRPITARKAAARHFGWHNAAVLLTLALLPPSAATAAEQTVAVFIDRAKVMRIARPADVVIIGNPAIADATIQDARTLIITGRSYGTTNLIVLDAAGEPVADAIVEVGVAGDNLVTVYKRAARETLSCTPDCSPTLTIGDREATFEAVSRQISTYSTIAGEAGQ
jgi:Flp pilus assembly secretin CpaC